VAAARVRDFFLGNIFQWNLSEMEAEARTAAWFSREFYEKMLSQEQNP